MVLFLVSILAVPSAAMADVALYKGTLEVVKSSGAICGSNEKKSYPIEVVVNSNGSGTDGYFYGADVSTGHFTGADLRNLQVTYPYDNKELAEGHRLSLQPTGQGGAGELREKHLSATEDSCSFDSARLTLTRDLAGNSETTWKESAARWEIELLNSRTYNFIASGKFPEATDAAERSLGLSERHFGSDSAVTAVALSNLAVIYRIQGRYMGAEPLSKRVLAIAEKTLGPEHPTVGIRLINLAELYEATGRSKQAEPLYRRALAIYEKALGPEHPDVAKVLNNLAVLCEAQGRYREAEPLLQRAVAIMQKTYGANAPSVDALRRNLEELRRKHPSDV